jgi:hypothetical protein
MKCTVKDSVAEESEYAIDRPLYSQRELNNDNDDDDRLCLGLVLRLLRSC